PSVYLFPVLRDADFVFLDLKATPAPTSPGDVYLRVRDMLDGGGWLLDASDDDFVVLRRAADARPMPALREVAHGGADEASLIEADLVPSPDGAIDVDGPHWILRTAWRTSEPLATGTRLEFLVELTGGEELHLWDIADLWWNPPQRWRAGKNVTVEVPSI